MNILSRRKILASLGGLIVASAGVLSTPSRAEYPEKPVEMTVLFGSTAQTIGQLLADLMSKDLHQPVVPVSRTGGGGAIGYTHVHSTAPDGYNIVWNSNSISTAYYQGNMPFNYEAFTPVARVSVETPALAVRADTGWKSLKEMVEAAKKSKDKLKVGASGKGSFTHLTTVALFNALGIGDKITYVPYDEGRAPAELLGGRVDAALQWPGQFVSHVKAGSIRVLAVTGSERVPVLPDVPTAKEQGADVNLTMWRGLAVPKGTPAAVVTKLEAAAKKATQSKAFQEASEKIGFTPAYLDKAEFAKLIETDDKTISKLMDELDLKKKK